MAKLHICQDILDLIYPVGAIYISTSSTNPSTFFGGTWEQIKDRFLLCAGSTYKAGVTGGEANHKLTVNEMPSHYHCDNSTYGGANSRKSMQWSVSSTGDGIALRLNGESGNRYPIVDPISNGGSQAHNNMPPYLAVYAWKRTK